MARPIKRQPRRVLGRLIGRKKKSQSANIRSKGNAMELRLLQQTNIEAPDAFLQRILKNLAEKGARVSHDSVNIDGKNVSAANYLKKILLLRVFQDIGLVESERTELAKFVETLGESNCTPGLVARFEAALKPYSEYGKFLSTAAGGEIIRNALNSIEGAIQLGGI